MTNKAFTLLEIVIATAIMAISLLMLIATVVMLKGTVYDASDRLVALHEARDHMETLLSLSYSDASLNIGTHAFAFSTGNYVGSYTVSSNTSFDGIKDIALTVNWVDPGSTITSSMTINGSLSSVLHQ